MWWSLACISSNYRTNTSYHIIRSSLHITVRSVSGLRYKTRLHLWLRYLGQLQSHLGGNQVHSGEEKPWSRYQMYDLCSCYRLCIKYIIKKSGKNYTQHRNLSWNLQLWLVIVWSVAGSHSFGDHQIHLNLFYCQNLPCKQGSHCIPMHSLSIFSPASEFIYVMSANCLIR